VVAHAKPRGAQVLSLHSKTSSQNKTTKIRKKEKEMRALETR
jgi:hypothetical protein